MSEEKPRLLMLPLGGCNGCHITVLDLYEEVADLFSHVEVVRASVIADMNRREVPKADIALIEGAVCNSDNEEVLKKVRENSKILITLGSCSSYGGIPSMRNFFKREDVVQEAYVDAVSNVNPEGVVPSDYEYIPELKEYVKSVGGVVPVDFMIPGCPPVPQIIRDALVALIKGEEPKLPTKNLCEECGRKRSNINPGDRHFITFKIDTVMESDLDPDICFLEQGVLCMGPATRSGCGGRCTKANMPCRGCMGPNPKAIEQGSELSNAMAPMLPIGALVNKEDLPGTFYRYSLAASIIPSVKHGYKELRKGGTGSRARFATKEGKEAESGDSSCEKKEEEQKIEVKEE